MASQKAPHRSRPSERFVIKDGTVKRCRSSSSSSSSSSASSSAAPLTICRRGNCNRADGMALAGKSRRYCCHEASVKSLSKSIAVESLSPTAGCVMDGLRDVIATFTLIL